MKKQFLALIILCCLLSGCITEGGEASMQKAGLASQKASLASRSGENRARASAGTMAEPGRIKSRTTLALLDASIPYAGYETALSQLSAAAQNLSPADNLMVALIAGEFKAQTSVYLNARLADEEDRRKLSRLFTLQNNILIANANQSELDVIWSKADKRIQAIKSALGKLNHQNKSVHTNLWGAIQYASQYASTYLDAISNGDEVILIIASDLEHDFGKNKTTSPPMELYNFKGVRVRLLWVTQNSKNWAKMKQEWGQYFKRCGVSEFTMLDSVQSSPDKAIERSPIARNVPHPLRSTRN